MNQLSNNASGYFDANASFAYFPLHSLDDPCRGAADSQLPFVVGVEAPAKGFRHMTAHIAL
jgi:hypothetical protein